MRSPWLAYCGPTNVLAARTSAAASGVGYSPSCLASCASGPSRLTVRNRVRCRSVGYAVGRHGSSSHARSSVRSVVQSVNSATVLRPPSSGSNSVSGTAGALLGGALLGDGVLGGGLLGDAAGAGTGTVAGPAHPASTASTTSTPAIRVARI